MKDDYSNTQMRQTASPGIRWTIRLLTVGLIVAGCLVAAVGVRDASGTPTYPHLTATQRYLASGDWHNADGSVATTWTWHTGKRRVYFDPGCARYNVLRRHHGQKPLDCHFVVWPHYTDGVRRSCPGCQAQPDGGWIWQQRQEYDVHALDYLWKTQTNLTGFYYPVADIAWIEQPHYGFTGSIDCSGQGTTFTDYSQGTCESSDLLGQGQSGVHHGSSGWNRWDITIGAFGHGIGQGYWVNVRLWPRGRTVWDAGAN